MFRCDSIAAIAAAAAMTIGSATFAQDATHTGMAPQSANPAPSTPASPTHGTERIYNNAEKNTRDLHDAQDSNMANNANNNNANHDADASVVRQLNMWKSSPDQAQDKLFALNAACGNAWEIAFGQLVAEKAQDQQVKDTASMIVKDHQAAQQKLEPIAQKLGVQIPGQLPADKQAELDLFRALPVDKLENTYVSMMRSDHLKDVNDFADEAKSAQDPDLKNFASETLPKLKEHAAMLIKTAKAKGMDTELNFNPMPMAQ